jgi:hypothetical protein
MYFETGQGAALSAEGHYGVGGRPVDEQTLEARAYGVARAFDPLLLNTVVGFIGPEYLHDGKQIIRAGLEDNFCGKLLGVPMGVDVCYTNHAEADDDDMETLLTLLGAAGTVTSSASREPTTSCWATRACRSTTRWPSAGRWACVPHPSSRNGCSAWRWPTLRATCCPRDPLGSPLSRLVLGGAA